RDYLLMIQKKTGKLVAVSTEMGALIANNSPKAAVALRHFGEYVGRAFQIQDDLLDITANEKEFGKTIGSDLQEGKRTFLFLEALRKARGKNKQLLLAVARDGGVSRNKIKQFQRIYRETGAIASAQVWVKRDLARARKELQHLRWSPARDMLHWFTDMLLHRTY
ncbi:MAG TPA: polyprenyl synthetase family protein, partial [Bacteroidota bacterium]